jgi:hypothetical protein
MQSKMSFPTGGEQVQEGVLLERVQDFKLLLVSVDMKVVSPDWVMCH